jgi:DNA-binding IclR family transcriptional regulator
VAEQSKTVDSALTLLALLAEAGQGTTAAALARSLGLSRSAVARLLATLESHGLARRAGPGWSAGLGLLTLAAAVEPQLRSLAHRELERLAHHFGETAVLSVRDGDEAVPVDQVVAHQHVVQVHCGLGRRHPVAVGAGGRALLVERPSEVAFSQDELETGVRGVAAAVFSPDHRPIASVALVAPVHRFPLDDEAARAVVTAARKISAGLVEPPSPTAFPGGLHAALPPGG